MDNSGDGYLESGELLAFARYYENDPSYSEERCARLMQMMDADSQGRVTQENFVDFFMQLTRHITDETTFDEGIARYLEVGERVSRDSRTFNKWKDKAHQSAELRHSVGRQKEEELQPPSDQGSDVHMKPARLERIQQVFAEMDDDSSGFISSAEMLEFAKVYKSNPNFSERRCKKLLMRIDEDGDGLISEAEFVQFFAGLTNKISDENEFNRGIDRYITAAKELQRRSRMEFQQG